MVSRNQRRKNELQERQLNYVNFVSKSSKLRTKKLTLNLARRMLGILMRMVSVSLWRKKKMRMKWVEEKKEMKRWICRV